MLFMETNRSVESNLEKGAELPNPLHSYGILVADADQQLATVFKSMLREMGFSNVHLTRSGADAQRLLQEQPFDFLITEWNIQHIDGIALIDQIRRDPVSSNPTLPIIMLTGRAEQADVAAARDTGINEYVVKPFSAKTIYDRLERIIEKPRPFVAAPSFVGPCRRRKGEPPPGVSNRRTLNIQPKRPPKEITGDHLIGSTPKIWTPDFSLRHKLGVGQTLNALITPAVLGQAQASIDGITADSLQWIKDNMAELKVLYQKMEEGKIAGDVVGNIKDVALTIHSRAGTFGYGRASEVAYKLYLFCRTQLRPDNPAHRTIVLKHIEVLQVILGRNMHGMGGKEGAQIAMELHNLVLKYAS